jgi:hypothetical protein
MNEEWGEFVLSFKGFISRSTEQFSMTFGT